MSKSLKNNIIIDFILSGIQAFIITFLIFIMFFGFLHMFFYNVYVQYLNYYNNSPKAMMFSLMISFLIFIVSFYMLFIKKISKITDYINEICDNLKKVSSGSMDIHIPKRRKDEIGILAQEVNSMTLHLKEYLQKEKQWDTQKINMITNLSHDLKTPLTSIIGFIKLMTEEEYNEKNFKHYLNIVSAKSNDLKNSINQLFEFSKISNYDFKPKKSIISLNELAIQVLMGFIPELIQNNIEYKIVNVSSNVQILGDSYLLIRAFENIITNTIKYAADGRYIELVIGKSSEESYISFINHGEKIAEKDIENIINKYYRCEKTCNKTEGTGLGLAIVQKIMEIHNGSLYINSTNEKTEFKLIFYTNKTLSYMKR
ncbi:MAG TPA: sensor histidine kinase [Clostridium sp.]|nr:sensor histidine kinase [Clostridium sp.]